MEITAQVLQYFKVDDTTDFGAFASNEDEEFDVEYAAEPFHKYDPKVAEQLLHPIYLGEVLNKRYLEKRDVAIKIMALGEWAEVETSIQDKIIQNMQDTSHLITYMATFLLPRPGNAARQLLEALKKLHNAGFLHRDLNERNCMWEMVPLHNLTRSAKYEALGRPLKIGIPFNLRTDDFYLGDFGLPMVASDPKPRGYPPMQFCSPDRLREQDPSPTLLCFVARLGSLPEKWKGLYTHPEGLDSWYNQIKTPDPAERDLALKVMLKVFTYDPGERLTATQLLHDPSFIAPLGKYGYTNGSDY
ncbi:hypothetical protein BDV12DRAFT_207999 [Aspergillus spectabilis]